MMKTSRIATLATVTALGAGAAVSMASPAQAAGSVWDRVAMCESTGNWSINTGNGFYGGLQFTHSTWIAFGGGAYAYNANGASRAEQIAVAQRVLASQGPGAWPVCSVQAGLTRSNGGSSGYTPVVTTHKTTKVTTHKVTTHKVTTHKVTTHKTAPVTTPAAKGTVRVQAGDTLSKIAAKHGTTWQHMWALNKGTLRNPNLIFVGQLLKY